MRLEGSLGAFSLADLLGLLAGTRKSGALRLRQDGHAGAVYLTDGAITGATSDISRQALARRLIGSGAIDDDAIGRAVKRAAEQPELGFGTVLLAEESVDRGLLAAAATEQAVDAVFDLMRWAQGEFSFDAEAANPDDVGIAHPVDRVLAEANARMEAWAAVAEPLTLDGTVLQMPVVLPVDPQVSRDEWALLALVDGRRSVGDLVNLTGCGQFAVASTLAALLERGLLEAHDRRGDHVTAVLRRQSLLAEVEGDGAGPTAPPPAPSLGVPPEEPEAVPAPPAAPESRVVPETPAAPEAPILPSAPPPSAPPATWTSEPASATQLSEGDAFPAAAVAGDDLDDAALNRSLMLRLIAGVRGL